MIDQDKMRALEQNLRDRHAYVFSITNPKYRDAASNIYEEAADAIDLLLAEVEQNRIDQLEAQGAFEEMDLENNRLRAELEDAAADKRDAERYRWLRDFDIRCKDGVNINPPCEHVHASMYSHAVGTIPAVRLVTGDELDRAVDAALAQR